MRFVLICSYHVNVIGRECDIAKFSSTKQARDSLVLLYITYRFHMHYVGACY